MKRILPRYRGGKGDGLRYIKNDDTGGWDRITNDDESNLMADLVVTPYGVRNKFNYESNPNYRQPVGKDVAVKADHTLPTRLEVEKINNTRTWRSDVADILHSVGDGAMMAANFVPFEGELTQGANWLYNTAKSYIKHPFYNTVYHGSTYPFNIKNAWVGTPYDIGLHVGPKKTAQYMAEGGPVYKLRIPLENTTVIDLGRNGVEHFDTGFPYKARPVIKEIPSGGPSYDTSIGDDLRILLLRDAGANPSVIWKDGWIGRLHTENDATLNLLDKEFPNLSQRARDYARRLNFEMKSAKGLSWHDHPEDMQWAKEINTKGALLLSDNGYKVLKYANANPYEVGFGGNSTSYIITDPSVMDIIPTAPRLKPLVVPTGVDAAYAYTR